MEEPTWAKVLFILTNLPYALAAARMVAQDQEFAPVLSQLQGLCEASSKINWVFVGIIGIVSGIFHSKQCFQCSNKKQRQAVVWWNELDLQCAFSYGFYLSVCFLKRSTVHFAPCVALLVGGGVFKLNGYYKTYFLLHGLWHVTVAWYMSAIVCNPA
ncbi:hypothetical protein TeGR_g1158 [Tetraparma gracilis]|uniref:Uncharacterized protein n=1 Tax=Tetraparma gracilis TaxID=2962635 RepID=A0ABQ6MFD7_9STRA|nr:hypothetical protein TeGR_g1158 [Tetraparma gracilis]